MKNCFWLTLVFVVVLGLSASQLHARGGGGHGGGHHGSHHHSSHHHHSGHHHHGDHHHHNNHHHAHWNGNHHPFSPGWYGNHGNAWNWGGGGNWWAPATFGAAATWLGMSAANPVAYAYPSAPTYQTADNGANQAPIANPAALASTLAQSGAANPANTAEFLPLGVFTLAPESEKDADAMVQLAVSKDGVLRGTYYDLVTDEAKPIQGAIDKKTQQVAFTVGTEDKTVFETALASLTGETGPLALHEDDGNIDRWTMARLDKPPVDEAPAAKSKG